MLKKLFNFAIADDDALVTKNMKIQDMKIHEGAEALALGEVEVLAKYNVPALCLDEQGIVRTANGPCCALLGHTASECTGRVFSEFLSDSDSELAFVSALLAQTSMPHATAVASASAEGPTIPVTIQTKAGARRFVMMTCERRLLPRADGGVDADDGKGTHSLLFICALREDVTKHVDAAYDLSAAALVAFQDTFIRRVFHKLRTPLHVICNAVGSEEFTEDDLVDVRHNAESLLGVVEDLTFTATLEVLPCVHVCACLSVCVTVCV
jgi:PAS domain-containing protein